MNTLIHGVKNAFRNTIRTFSVTLILAISIGLALVMLLAYRTVSAKLETVKSSIGNTIAINPAGGRGLDGGGEPLTQGQINDVKGLEHVTKIDATLTDRMTPGTDTSLTSAIDPGTLGNRFNNRTNQGQTGRTGQANRPFVLPVMITGVTDTSSLTSGTSSLTAGSAFAGDSDNNDALLGKALADKNSLTPGSTFTAFGTTVTVKGVYDAGNQFANSGLYVPLKTAQRLTNQTDQITGATATVDSISNLDSVVTAVQNKIGTDKADVTSSQDTAKQAIAPLENVKNISLYSLIGSLVAGAIITLLTMMMIVRERRREIGVLKAIGASNVTVVMQFIAESLTLTVLGGVAGIILGFFLSNPILSALVSSSIGSTQAPGPVGGGGGGRLARFGQMFQLGGAQGIQNNIRSIHAVVSYDILLYGLLAAAAIAIVGSAVPAWLIAKLRPAEVMRGE